MSNLNNVNIGEGVMVKNIFSSMLSTRLKEVGFCEGKEIKVLFKAAFKGPIAIDVGGWVLCMRYEDASQIEIYK